MVEIFLFYCLLGVVLCENGLLRLSTEHSIAEISHSGFVQMLVDQQWLDVYTSFNWTIAESDIVCKQLGYTQAIDILDENYHCAATNRTSKRIIIDVECTGLEVNLNQCIRSLSVNNSKTEYQYSPCGVICAVPFSLRLITSSIQNNVGKLEVLLDYEWESLCGSKFDQSYAKVACRQLGYIYGQYTKIDDTIGSYAYVNGNCTGHEYNLIGCTNDVYNSISITNCSSSVYLECFSPPSQPCLVSTSHLTCDTVSLTWSFLTSTIDQYYIRYRVLDEESWTEINHSNASTSVTTIIDNLEPLVTYEVTIKGSNLYGNGTFADVVEVTPMFPELPAPQLISLSAESANISFEVHLPMDCTLLCIYGFDVHLLSTGQVITITFTLNQLIEVGPNRYTAYIDGLKDMTLYSLAVRILAVKCTDSSYIVYGPYSESIDLNTLPAADFGVLDLTLLKNPYVSLTLFISTVFLIIVALFLIILLCSCHSVRRHYHDRKRKSSRIYQRRESIRDDNNIYAAGDLSEQSYIPMTSSSVPSTLRIVARRISNTPSINGPRSLWIDIDRPVLPTTFNNEEHGLNHVSSPAILERTDEKDEENDNEKEDDYDDDNPYDVISKIKEETDTNISEDDDENVYDVIINTEVDSNNNGAQTEIKPANNEELKLPEAHRLSQIQSQDSHEMVPHVLPMLPPPREFAALPPVPLTGGAEYDKRYKQLKGHSISMCTLPLPSVPSPNSRPNFKTDTKPVINRNISEGEGMQLEGREVRLFRSRDRRKTVDTDSRDRIRAQRTRQRERTSSLNRLQKPTNVHIETDEQDNEAPYYSIPPQGNIPSGAQSLKSDDDNERCISPEYEILLHPLSQIAIKKDREIKLSRPSRPPPPVPDNNATPRKQEEKPAIIVS